MLFLLQATGFDRPSVVRVLLEAGADPNIKNNVTDAPLTRGKHNKFKAHHSLVRYLCFKFLFLK